MSDDVERRRTAALADLDAYRKARLGRDADIVTAYLSGADVTTIATAAGMTRTGVRMVLDRMGVERPRKP